MYRDLGCSPPLAGDDPAQVCGLAVEVFTGEPRVEYQVGVQMHVEGEMLASIPVPCAAPNDIAASATEQAKIAAAQTAYGRAVREAFARYASLRVLEPRAVIVRHHPQRDEDNTWQTWFAAICGVSQNRRPVHWSDGAPMSGRRPTAVASIADSGIDVPVTYELWA